MLIFVGVSILLERRECARCCCDALLTYVKELERGTYGGAVWIDMEEFMETIDDERGIRLLFGWLERPPGWPRGWFLGYC